MFSDNRNLDYSDNLNCVIHSQKFKGDTDMAFSMSFILRENSLPPVVTFQNIRIVTDDHELNTKNNTLAKVLKYKTCRNSAYADLIYFNFYSEAFTKILYNNGKDLKCMAAVNKDGGIKITIFLRHV